MYKDFSKNVYYNTKQDIIILEDEYVILDAIENLLLTEPNNIPFSNFGCPLRQYLFMPLSYGTGVDIQRTIKESIKYNITGIRDVKVALQILRDYENTFLIKIQGVLQKTGKPIAFEKKLSEIRG